MARSEPTLAEIGESALIARLARRAERVPGPGWRLRIGDDAALLRPPAGQDLVFSTDAVVEGTHFRRGRETPRTVGRRALAVSLSDLAAMGARPVGALLDLAAPATGALREFDAVVAGFVDEGRRHDCPLVGGNLARSSRWSLDVTVIGAVPRGRALRRRGLRPGDGLYVTGSLGGAALARLRADARGGRLTRVPTPRLDAGRALARLAGARACLDVSDGLATDLGHLLAGDGLGARVDPARLPRPRGFDRACRALGLDPTGVITGGGEDYELLFAFRSQRNGPEAEAKRLGRALGLPVTWIGDVRHAPGLEGLPAPRGHHFAP